MSVAFCQPRPCEGVERIEVRDRRRRTATVRYSSLQRDETDFTMKFSHTEEKRDGRHLDVLTDEENGLRIIVSRLGAELISMARINEAGNWIGFLYRDNDLSAPPRLGKSRHGHGLLSSSAEEWQQSLSRTRNQGRHPRFSSLENMASRRIFHRGERRFAKIPNYSRRFFANRISAEGECGSHLSD